MSEVLKCESEDCVHNEDNCCKLPGITINSLYECDEFDPDGDDSGVGEETDPEEIEGSGDDFENEPTQEPASNLTENEPLT